MMNITQSTMESRTVIPPQQRVSTDTHQDLNLTMDSAIHVKNFSSDVANVANVAGNPLLALIDPILESTRTNQLQFSAAKNRVDEVLAQNNLDTERLFSPETVQALQLLRTDPAIWIIYRAKIKAKYQGLIRISDLDRLVETNNSESAEKSEAKSSIVSELVAYVLKIGEVFYDPYTSKSYLSATVNDAATVLQIGSQSFNEWLSYSYYDATKVGQVYGLSISDVSVKQVATILAGIAKNSDKHQHVHLRVAQTQDAHYIAIGDKKKTVIEVTATGWQLLNNCHVKFWQPSSMQPLPIPETGGNLDDLWVYVNVPKAARPLVLAWLLESLREETPKPILSLAGVQGSAKSSTQTKLRELIDNNSANLRTAPKRIEDLYVGTASNWLVSFENISQLSRPIQDALCTFATGAGAASRKLYSDADEHIISYKRPVIINGIPQVITAQDLTDRVICLELPVIEEYIEEADLKPRWEQAKPKIFGGLLDLFVKTLAQLPKVQLHKPPRMADFTRLGEAMMQAQGYPAGTFQTLYEANRQYSTINALEASSVAQALSAYVDKTNLNP